MISFDEAYLAVDDDEDSRDWTCKILILDLRLANLTHSVVGGDCCRPDIGVVDGVDDDLHKIVFVSIHNLTNLQHLKLLSALLLLLLLPRRRSTMEDDVAIATAVAVGDAAVLVLLLLSTF